MKAKTKITPNTKPRSPSQLAAILGVSRQLISYHKRNPAAPVISDVAGWTIFLEEIGRDASLPAPLKREMAVERLRLIRAQADEKELANKAKSGELIEWDKVEKFIKHQTGILFFGELERMAAEFPASLKGKTELEIQAEVKQQIGNIKKSLTITMESFAKDNEPNEKAKTETT